MKERVILTPVELKELQQAVLYEVTEELDEVLKRLVDMESLSSVEIIFKRNK